MAYDVGVLEEPSYASEASIHELGESDLDQVTGGWGALVLAVGVIVVIGYAAYKEGREDGYADTRCT